MKLSSALSAAFVLILITLTGCRLFQNKEELNRLLSEDEAFRTSMERKEASDKKISEISRLLSQKKADTRRQINHLKAEYETFDKAQRLEINQEKKIMQKEREQWAREVERLANQIEQKEREVMSLEGSRKEIADVLREDKAVKLSEGEKRDWKARLDTVLEKIRLDEDEISHFRADMRKTKRKLDYLSS